MKGLRELLEQRQQQQKPPFDLTTLQHPFWQQPGLFPSSMQSPTPMQGRSGDHMTAQDIVARSHNEKQQHTPSERKHSVDQLQPLTSKVAMDHSTHPEHVRYPEHVLANGRDGVSNKPRNSSSKTINRIKPHKKQRHRHDNIHYSSTSQTNHSDSSTSSLTSSSLLSNGSPVPSNKSPVPWSKSPVPSAKSPVPRSKSPVPSNKSPVSDDKSSVLSELGSPQLSPLRGSSPRGASSVTMETIKVPSNANLSTWVCPLCGGRSIIIDNSGTRKHHHQLPDKIKTRSRSTQHDGSSYRRSSRSTRNRSASPDPISSGLYSGYNLRSSGLHRDSDTSTVRSGHIYNPNTKDSGLHYNTDIPRSRSLHYDDNIPSSSLHRDTIPNIRNLDYNHSTSGNKSRSLHYNDDIASSGLYNDHNTPHKRSSGLHYDTNTPHIRSSGINCDTNTPYARGHPFKQTKPYKRHRRKYQQKPSSVKFSHPKATSTPAYLYTTTHGCTSDSSDVSSSVVGGADNAVLSVPPLPRYVTRHRVTSPVQQRRRRYYGSRYVVTSSDDEIEYQPVTR